MALDPRRDIKDSEYAKFLDDGSGETAVRVIDSVSNSLAPNVYDFLALTTVSGNLTQIIYKTGGAAGTTVSTLQLTYDISDNLTTVTKI